MSKNNDEIFQLVYISESTETYGRDVLHNILEKSVKNNKANYITGILIYNGGFFIQLLEGNSQDILKTYAKVSKDSRHTNIRQVYEGYSDKRFFLEWSMAYKNIEEYSPKIQEKIDIFIYSLSKGSDVYMKEHAIELIKKIRFDF